MIKIKSIIRVAIACAFFLVAYDVQAFQISNHSTPYTGPQCSWANVTIREYFNTPFQPRDMFTSSAFVQLQPVVTPSMTDPSKTTEIGIYNYGSMLNCGDMNSWIYPSAVVPSDKVSPAINTVVAVAKWPTDLCRVVALPANRDDIIAQFVFINAYREVSWLGAGTSWTVWVTSPVAENVLLPLPTNYVISPDYIPSSTVKFEQPECLNIQAAWCGDGVVDAGYETCDPADASHTGWWAGGCSVSCAPVAVACAVGTTTGAQGAALTAASPGLCAAGAGAVGNFTATVAGATTNYTWSCAGVSGGSCNASYTPAGGGGGGSSCNAGTTTWVQSSPLTATSTGLCSLGSASVSNFSSSVNGNTTFYSWSCDGVSGGSCSASYTSSSWGGGGGWGSSSGWWGGGWWWGGGATMPTGWAVTVPGSSAYCGNGIVERPNASGQRENCDTNAPWCVSCNIASTNPGSTGPGNLMITNPGAGGSISLIGYRLIVGDKVPLFSGRDIILQSNYPVYIENKTATVTNNSPLISGASISKIVNDVGIGGEIRFENRRIYSATGALQRIVYNKVDYPSTLTIFDTTELTGFVGDTSSFADNPSVPYRDTPKTSSPSSAVGAFYTSLQFLETALSVRVAKPLVSNVAGGNAYIGRPIGYDVNTVASNFLSDLKTGNFTSTTVNATLLRWGRNLSSATKSVTDDATMNAIVASGSASEERRIQGVSTALSRGVTRTVDILSSADLLEKTDRFAESEWVRIVRGANLRIGKNISLSGVRTIIVEDGDLLIDKDLVYADKKASYAFIVKKWNIIVADTVKKMAGVYVALVGSIRSNGVSTVEILSVDGSLYGHDMSDLSDKRSYVRGDASDTALATGIVVSYSNRALVSPPPLLSQFLEQYSVSRVAK